MKCVVNVKGYVRMKGFDDDSVNGTILPYIGKDNYGVFVVNDAGNMIHVSSHHYDVL